MDNFLQIDPTSYTNLFGCVSP